MRPRLRRHHRNPTVPTIGPSTGRRISSSDECPSALAATRAGARGSTRDESPQGTYEMTSGGCQPEHPSTCTVPRSPGSMPSKPARAHHQPIPHLAVVDQAYVAVHHPHGERATGTEQPHLEKLQVRQTGSNAWRRPRLRPSTEGSCHGRCRALRRRKTARWPVPSRPSARRGPGSRNRRAPASMGSRPV